MTQDELLNLIRKTYKDEHQRFTSASFRKRTGQKLDGSAVRTLLVKGLLIRVPLMPDDPRRSTKADGNQLWEYHLA